MFNVHCEVGPGLWPAAGLTGTAWVSLQDREASISKVYYAFVVYLLYIRVRHTEGCQLGLVDGMLCLPIRTHANGVFILAQVVVICGWNSNSPKTALK